MSSHIDVFFVYISGHAKVGDLAHFFITYQYVPSGQIAMDYLNNKPKMSQFIFNKISYVIVSLRKNTSTELTKKLSKLKSIQELFNTFVTVVEKTVTFWWKSKT